MGRRMVTKSHFWWLLGLFQHRGGHYCRFHQHYHHPHHHRHYHYHDHYHYHFHPLNSLKTIVNVWLLLSIMINTSILITIHLRVSVITLSIIVIDILMIGIVRSAMFLMSVS